MKRSEVTRLIQNELAKNCGAMEFPIPVSELCDKILRVVEEVGMIPPRYTERMSCGCCSSYQEGSWEKE